MTIGENQVGTAILEGHLHHMPLLHHKLIGQIKLVEHCLDDFDVTACSLACVVDKLVRLQIPVADDHDGALTVVSLGESLCRCLEHEGEENDDGSQIAAEGEDTQQTAVIVMDCLQHVFYLLVAHIAGGMMPVGFAEIGKAGMEPVVEVGMGTDLLVDVALIHLAGHDIGILDTALLIEEDNPRVGRIEHRPVAQRARCIDLAQIARGGDILLGADNDRGAPVFVATQHREHDDEIADAVVATLHILGLELELQLFLLVASGILMLIHQTVDGILQQIGVVLVVTLHELIEGVGAGHLSVLVVPGKLLTVHMISPDAHLAGLDDECQATVQLIVSRRDAQILQSVDHDIGDGGSQQQQCQGYQIPQPCRGLRLFAIGIEPLVLERLQLVGGEESGISLIELMEQVLIVRHESVFAVRHVDWRQFHLIQLILLDEPFQGKRTTYDLSFLLVVHLLDRLPDILAYHDMIIPVKVEHQMMAEAGITDDDLCTRLAQIAEILDRDRLALRRDDTLGGEDDGIMP